MTHIETSVVYALMTLRQIDAPTLANLVHVKLGSLIDWLKGDHEALPHDYQMEILHILGIKGEAPRGDIVHYWTIQETFWSGFNSTYDALDTIMNVFGPAQIVHIAADSDPAFTSDSRSIFGLRFENFMAILDIKGHPWRGLRFDPERLKMSWISERPVVGVPPAVYNAMEPGAFGVVQLQRHMLYNEEVTSWERICAMALDSGMRASEAEEKIFNSHSEKAVEELAPPVVTTPVVQAVESAPLMMDPPPPVLREELQPLAEVAPPPVVRHMAMPVQEHGVRSSPDTKIFSTPVRRPEQS